AIMREPPARRGYGRLVALSGFAVAAAMGAAIALFVAGKFPSDWSKGRPDGTPFTSRFAGDAGKAPEQQRASATRPATVAASPAAAEPPRAASARETSQDAPAVRGVTDTEIRFGISAPFTGAAKELGNQMKLGIDSAFNAVNDAGGINGRQLRLVAADDGYEPA